ncbi:unnamed protein product [marine sediment metagenome]|uniref:Uncharacterized protein n=1 Tax=marine sediment metagenome TaxID=412755 RepID=X1A6X3_9ZZZZ
MEGYETAYQHKNSDVQGKEASGVGIEIERIILQEILKIPPS